MTLKAKFRKAKFNQFQIQSHSEREPIVLRDENKQPVEYKDTETVSEMREVLSDYNKLLDQTHIDIYNLEKPLLIIGKGKKKMRLQINQQDKFVRRVLINLIGIKVADFMVDGGNVAQRIIVKE